MKKSLYVYLSALLGVLLFLTVHRAVVSFCMILAAYGYEPLSIGVSTIQFLALEYVSLFLAVLLGTWYGIWLGLYWYEKVYEQRSFGGVASHIGHKFLRSPKKYDLKSRMESAKQKLESGAWKLEDLAAAPVGAAPAAIKRKVVRKRAPKKINSVK